MFQGHGRGEDYEDDSLDVFQYFTASCYSGYNDGEKVSYMMNEDSIDVVISCIIDYKRYSLSSSSINWNFYIDLFDTILWHFQIPIIEYNFAFQLS